MNFAQDRILIKEVPGSRFQVPGSRFPEPDRVSRGNRRCPNRGSGSNRPRGLAALRQAPRGYVTVAAFATGGFCPTFG